MNFVQVAPCLELSSGFSWDDENALVNEPENCDKTNDGVSLKLILKALLYFLLSSAFTYRNLKILSYNIFNLIQFSIFRGSENLEALRSDTFGT